MSLLDSLYFLLFTTLICQNLIHASDPGQNDAEGILFDQKFEFLMSLTNKFLKKSLDKFSLPITDGIGI